MYRKDPGRVIGSVGGASATGVIAPDGRLYLSVSGLLGRIVVRKLDDTLKVVERSDPKPRFSQVGANWVRRTNHHAT